MKDVCKPAITGVKDVRKPTTTDVKDACKPTTTGDACSDKDSLFFLVEMFRTDDAPRPTEYPKIAPVEYASAVITVAVVPVPLYCRCVPEGNTPAIFRTLPHWLLQSLLCRAATSPALYRAPAILNRHCGGNPTCSVRRICNPRRCSSGCTFLIFSRWGQVLDVGTRSFQSRTLRKSAR